jgi:cytochrome P450
MRHGATQQECETEGFLQLIAGSDTTGTSIRATMMYIMSTPRVYRSVKDEIKEAVDNKQASMPISLEQAKKLPYLQVSIHSVSRKQRKLDLFLDPRP